MLGPKLHGFLIALIGLAVPVAFASEQVTKPAGREAMYSRYLDFASYVKGGSVTPRWMADGNRFWYAEGAPANTVVYKIDPGANTKTPLFDTARLRRALTPVLGHEPPYQGLPFAEFAFLPGEKAVTFTLEEKEFILRLDSYEITRAPALTEEEKRRSLPQSLSKALGYWWDIEEEISPDGRWLAGVRDHNLYLRSPYDGRRVPLTEDGIADHEWGRPYWGQWVSWSPDSFRLATWKEDYRKVPKTPIVHYLKPREEVEWAPDPRAGEPQPQREIFIIDILTKRQIRVDTGAEPEQTLQPLGWRPDGSELLLFRLDRWGMKPQIIAADPATGATRVVFTEPTRMFPWSWEQRFTLLQDGRRFLWTSGRDGGQHLYLYDLEGKLIRQLTEGALPVGQVVAVDEKSGWVYFTGPGDRRPSDNHLYRVSLDGKGFTCLTQATGQHEILFAPSRQFFLDSHSSRDRPPAVELRRADGTLLRKLAEADIEALKELKWSPPEEFAVKSADGKTDRYGVLYKPYDFDPNRRYPVIEEMSPGGRNFAGGAAPQALAQLGFIVFKIELSHRLSGDAIPEHVAALKQLAAARPYMDLSRVGVKGGSYPGYLALRAMLQAPEVYHVGVAVAPITDMAEHAGWGIMLGPPESNRQVYEDASNLRLAGNLKGKLMLIHGTSDTSVPFSHTMKMVDALVRADKRFDLMVLPGWGHWSGLEHERIERYLDAATRRYFQEHLKP